SAKQSVIAFEETGSRFFKNINWNSFVQLEQIRQSDGLWYSNYTSTWLEDKYNIPTHYVDTRHNDNLFRAQARRAKILGIKEYEDNYKIYADFLIRKLEEGRTMQTQNGKFLIDYFSDYSNELTHVSLNHALSLMNYFYYSYLHSGERKYLAAGDTLLQALVDTGEDWISENGNLRYQLNPDGTYQGNDYKLVTYYDLLYSKALLWEIKKKEYQVIEKLIEVKEAYLDGLGIDYRVDMERIEDYLGVIE